MESKKINQLATEMAPAATDLTIIGDPITGVSKKITLLQLSATIGTGADLQGVTDNGATTTNPIAIGGLTITGLATGVLKSDSGVISSVPFGAANGVATLGGDGKVPSIQLPSYVDDVVEVANFAALPVTGETGKIYITLDNNKVYRWTGSIYVEIAANNAVWGAITGTLSNQTDLQNALNAKVPYTGATANVDLGTFDLTADVITGATGSFASSGGSDTFAINHSSGSGVALNITKGGNNEGLYINKTSGSGNAATIIGTLNATTLVKSGGTSSQFLKADGSVDASAYITLAALSATSPIFYNSTTGVISSQAASATLQGFVTTSSQTIAGVKTFSNGIVMDNGSSGVPLEFKQYASAGYSGTGYTSLFALNNSLCINFGNPSGFIILNTTTLTSNRTFTFQNASGTLALTSDLSAYLPLTGGTLTGALSGTSATFSTEVTSSGSQGRFGGWATGAGYQGAALEVGVSGGTATLIGYNRTSGAYIPLTIGGNTNQTTTIGGNTIVLQNNGTTALTIASTGAATFSSSVTVNGVYNVPSTSYFVGNATWGYRFNNAADTSNLVVIKDNGNVGIGTSSPQLKFVVSNSGSQGFEINSNSGSYSGGIDVLCYNRSTSAYAPMNFDASQITFGTNGSGERMRITSGGNVCVNKTSGDGKFNIEGTFYMYGMSSGAGTSTLKYSTSTGLVTYDSSARIFKKDIVNLEYGLDAVLKMQPKKYKWKSNNIQDLGFIADEMHQIIPEIVFLAENKINKSELKDGEPMGINYDRLVPVLVKAIQELKAEIDELKNK
jgi:hypothetical protein